MLRVECRVHAVAAPPACRTAHHGRAWHGRPHTDSSARAGPPAPPQHNASSSTLNDSLRDPPCGAGVWSGSAMAAAREGRPPARPQPPSARCRCRRCTIAMHRTGGGYENTRGGPCRATIRVSPRMSCAMRTSSSRYTVSNLHTALLRVRPRLARLVVAGKLLQAASDATCRATHADIRRSGIAVVG